MPPSALPAIATSSFLSTLRAQAHLPAHTWYYIAGITLSTLNRPDELPKVFEYALEHDANVELEQPGNYTKLVIARRLREGLIKSAAVVGLPKTINALLSLKSATPNTLGDPPLSMSPTRRPIELFDVPTSQILLRGERFFDGVYGKVAQRVMGQMDRCGTEDLGLIARLMYGYLLSNIAVLNARDSSFVLLAALIPQDVNPQLKGHLKGAVNNGASTDEVRAVREICIKICKAAGMRHLKHGESGFGWTQEVAHL